MTDASSLPPPPPPAATPPLGPTPGEGRARAASEVRIPAIAMIVTSSLGLLAALGSLLFVAVTTPAERMAKFAEILPQFREQFAEAGRQASQAWDLVVPVLCSLAAFISLVGGIRMLQLRTRGLAVAGAICLMLNAQCCCCLLGIPIGIWALVVLMRDHVKAAFA